MISVPGKNIPSISFRILPLLTLLLLQSRVTAQSIQFNMEVQPEIGIEVLQDLNFGTVVANSGTQQISLGDNGMGIFEIRAFSAQNAYLSIQIPDSLREENSMTGYAIPLTINAVYTDRPANFNNPTPFEDNKAWVSLSSGGGSGTDPSWQTGYVYVFGEIQVGDISQGVYSGTLTLNVSYQ